MVKKRYKKKYVYMLGLLYIKLHQYDKQFLCGKGTINEIQDYQNVLDQIVVMFKLATGEDFL